MEQRKSVRMTARLALALIFNSPVAFAAYQYSVDLLPGQIFSSQADAEAALHAFSPQASHLTRERLVSETPTQKVWLYSVPPQPLAPAAPALYGASYYLVTGYWAAPPLDSVDAAIDHWWQRYQRYWAYAFPGCSYSTTYYPNGQYTNRFARVTLAGTCGGAGEVTGTQVQPPKPAHCPPDYLNTGSECVIALTAYMTETLVEECPIAPLSDPIIPHDEALAWEFERKNGRVFDYDNLSTSLQNKLVCMERETALSGGTSRRESAYRPSAYQRHLREVWDKQKEIDQNWHSLTAAEKESCAYIFNQVAAEMSKHAIQYPPASNSRHERLPAEAFDLRIDMPSRDRLDAVIDFNAFGCGLHRFNIYKDPNHFQEAN